MRTQTVERKALPTLAQVEKTLGAKAAKWHGRCYEIACAIVDRGLVNGVAVYGHWLGPVSPSGYWKSRAHTPFVQHGWIKLRDGRVLDPTRFSFENKKPYLYIGPDGPEYDEGGNQLKAAMRPPPPKYDPSTQVTLKLSKAADRYVRAALGRPKGDFSRMQLSWIANSPVQELGAFATELYAAIEVLGYGAFIPYDNRRMVAEGRQPKPLAGPFRDRLSGFLKVEPSELPVLAGHPTKTPLWKSCFSCDGTGLMCNICGESETSCKCEGIDHSDCPDCKGSGRIDVNAEE